MSRPATALDGMDTTLPVTATCIRCSAIILAARSTRRRRLKVDTFEISLADRYSSVTKSGMADFIDRHFHSWYKLHEWSAFADAAIYTGYAHHHQTFGVASLSMGAHAKIAPIWVY